MKRPLARILFVVAVAAGTFSTTLFAESGNSVNLTLGGVPQLMPHCTSRVFNLEYERLIGRNITGLVRGGGVDYRFDDGNYKEDGRPRGIDIGARYYQSGGMKGFFIGGAVGSWKNDWTFIEDKGTPIEAEGKGDTDSLRLNVDIGARLPLGSSSISIMPMLNLGRFFSHTSCEYIVLPASKVGRPCTRDTEVGYYAFAAVSAGIEF